MSRYLTTSAITLRWQPWREDDRVYTLFASATGKVEAIAPGSQKLRSKLAGHLEPFGEVLVTLAQRGQTTKLAGAVCRRRYRRISQHGPALEAAGRCFRLTRSVVGVGQPDFQVYALLKELLEQLDSASGEPTAAAAPTVYAMQLMRCVGLQPRLDRCGRCSQMLAEGFFDIAAGAVRCRGCAAAAHVALHPVESPCLRYLQAVLAATFPQALRLPVTPDAALAARQLTDRFLEYHTEVRRRTP